MGEMIGFRRLPMLKSSLKVTDKFLYNVGVRYSYQKLHSRFSDFSGFLLPIVELENVSKSLIWASDLIYNFNDLSKLSFCGGVTGF